MFFFYDIKNYGISRRDLISFLSFSVETGQGIILQKIEMIKKKHNKL